jgi:hypothetical protein
MSAAETIRDFDLPRLFDQFRREKFYGRVSFDLREGEVTLIRTERTQLVSAAQPHQGVTRDGINTQPR